MRNSMLLVCCALLSGLFAHQAIAATLRIREQPVRYTADAVRYPMAGIFMIVPADQNPLRTCNTYQTGCVELPVIHFGLGSAEVTAHQRQILLAGLKRCRISKATPLKITGYTCPIGTRAGNLVISLLRARAVASMLRCKGYTINPRDILGKGQNDLVTRDPKKFALNRRVVISQN
jgi:outer membrane protein OmpA-like peptidoglycan-associated protein